MIPNEHRRETEEQQKKRTQHTRLYAITVFQPEANTCNLYLIKDVTKMLRVNKGTYVLHYTLGLTLDEFQRIYAHTKKVSVGKNAETL